MDLLFELQKNKLVVLTSHILNRLFCLLIVTAQTVYENLFVFLLHFVVFSGDQNWLWHIIIHSDS
jgi:hypothetical protein